MSDTVDLKVKLGIETSSATKQIKELTNELKTIDKEIKSLDTNTNSLAKICKTWVQKLIYVKLKFQD